MDVIQDFYFRHLHQQARKCFSLKSLPAVTQQRELQDIKIDDWPDPFYYHNFIQANNWHFLSLWNKTENDITRKVEGTDSQFEEVLGLLE